MSLYSHGSMCWTLSTAPWKRMGEWMYRPTFSWLRHYLGGKWSSSRPGRFTPAEKAPGTHWIGGWVDPRAGLDYMEKWKFLTPPVLELRPLGRPARSQWLSRLLHFIVCSDIFRRNLCEILLACQTVRWHSYILHISWEHDDPWEVVTYSLRNHALLRCARETDFLVFTWNTSLTPARRLQLLNTEGTIQYVYNKYLKSPSFAQPSGKGRWVRAQFVWLHHCSWHWILD
jgi:hypothetical protein